MLRMSTYFLRTLREDPADAEVASHRLLLRAGYIRRAAPGIYTWLPLGLRVLRRIEAIVREEMDTIASELQFPTLLPREPYERTGRWTEYGANLFRLADRKGADMLLGPTHEEMFTLTVKDLYSSYKDLPLSIYQIQTKYRDEARPRAGLLRGREFVMKDSYSFDIDDEGLKASYEAHRIVYQRIFKRLGLDFVICAATSGAMGGSRSEEFLHPIEIGEDTFVRSAGGYAANVEAVTTVPPEPLSPEEIAALPAAHVEATPGASTIQALVDFSNQNFVRESKPWTRYEMLKHLVYMLHYPDGRKEPLVIAIPGDREVDEKRLAASVEPAEALPFTDEDFDATDTLAKGYIGPAGLGEKGESGIRYLVDPRVVPGTVWVAGAGEKDKHVYDLVYGRDFVADGTIEAAEVRAGDPAPDGSGPLELARGIEIGHIFQLGRKYADALDLKVLNQNGQQVTVTMGSYGIGISRALAAIAESQHDERGLMWPRSLAPADVHIVATGKDSEVFRTAEDLAGKLEAQGFTVLYDDRLKVSPGVKFKDAELIGVPTLLIVGKGLADGMVEIKDRRTLESRQVPVDQALAEVRADIEG
ncbi:proline--tRNA ligase [Devriesea agamarum]|uniref:proline--tRNA ligase n=1 Tax=Devriesea agamarum TaxID=472569 RepID=UPI00071D24A7|nr:proline--tRNA ligase [Devriesea agamarum]